MRPAFSLIFFTSLSGLGFGLAASLGFGIVAPSSGWWGLIQNGIALALITAGLLSSTFHLGHPERAWRAFSQWRSSWLSREGVLASLSSIALIAYGIYGYIDNGSGRMLLGFGVGVLSLLTIWSTAMIYASLKTVARWHHPLTPFVFLTLALTGGLMLAIGLDGIIQGESNPTLNLYVIAALVLSGAVLVVWSRHAGTSESTPETATGLGDLGSVRMLMPPHSEENWLQHEMGFKVGRKHARVLTQISFVLLMPIPILLMVLAEQSPVFVLVATFIHFAGVMVSRWLFFAEAKHTVMLYYGERH